MVSILQSNTSIQHFFRKRFCANISAGFVRIFWPELCRDCANISAGVLRIFWPECCEYFGRICASGASEPDQMTTIKRLMKRLLRCLLMPEEMVVGTLRKVWTGTYKIFTFSNWTRTMMTPSDAPPDAPPRPAYDVPGLVPAQSMRT